MEIDTTIGANTPGKLLGSAIILAATLGSASAFAANASFPTQLLDNSTGFADNLFVGAPDGANSNGNGTVNWVGIGGKVVTFDFLDGLIINGTGGDFNVYEVDFATQEFAAATYSVSQDGITFFDVSASQAAIVAVDNDPGHVSDVFARSFDIAGTGLDVVRYVRIDGDGGGAAGGRNGFDLDAVGAVNFEVAAVPVPAAVWLFGSALAGIAGLRRRS